MKNYWSKKKVLVTGAGGFVGSYICEELIAQGANVTAVVRNKSNISNLSPFLNKLSLKEIDLTDTSGINEMIIDEVIIIHAAAVDGGSGFKKKFANKIFTENMLMNINMLKSVENKKIEKFLYISSAEVYRNIKTDKSIKENDFTFFSPTKNEDWYPFSKVIGEQICRLINSFGIKTIIVRPANIYGLRDDQGHGRLIPTLLSEIKAGNRKIRLKGDGRQLRSFLFAQDYVKNLLGLISSIDNGIFNIAGEKVISIKNFVEIFGKIGKLTIEFEDKSQDAGASTDRFVLDVSKIKRTIPFWYDSPYEKKIEEMIRQIGTN